MNSGHLENLYILLVPSISLPLYTSLPYKPKLTGQLPIQLVF